MSKFTGNEAFPPLNPQQVSFSSAANTNNANVLPTGRMRRGSSLGGDPRGDTGATSLATSNMAQQSNAQSPPSTPLSRTANEKLGRTHSKRKKARSMFSKWKRMSLRHTWVNPLVLVLIILGLYYINPGEQNPLHPAIFLSYANPPLNERTTTIPTHLGNPTQYGKGAKDFAFVGFYIIVLSFTREFLMQRMIRPIALAAGIRNRGKIARFMEQFYTAIYFAIFGPFGLFVMSRSPMWSLDTATMYEGFPHRAHEAYFKAYYLLQAAYWGQQGLVLMLQLEKPRKDFKELVLHHIITLALIWLSYRFHFTYIGLCIYITMDVSDFFLATSKIFNYLDWPIVGPYFLFFLCVWGYLRHYMNLIVLWSMRPGGEFQTVGPYDLNWETQQYKCWLSQSITFALLAALQAVNIFWFVLIVRIAIRFLFKGEEKDIRSEDEADEEEEQEQVDMADKPALMLNGTPVTPTEATATGIVGKEGAGAQRRR